MDVCALNYLMSIIMQLIAKVKIFNDAGNNNWINSIQNTTTNGFHHLPQVCCQAEERSVSKPGIR